MSNTDVLAMIVLGCTACGSSPPRPVAAPPVEAQPPPPAAQPLMTAPAPITSTGHVAGAPTDYVFVLVTDADPETPGLALPRGDQLRLVMPTAFARNAGVAISPDTDANTVLTKGWPQGAVKLPDQYRVGWDDASHALTLTAIVDITPAAPNAPGIKVLHLRGNTFTNPAAGSYPVALDHLAASGEPRARWEGTLTVVDRPPAARLAPSNFHLPPGTNANFQTAAPGTVLPHRLGLLLWAEGAPLDDVGIAPRDLTRHPTYTGGLLIQDTDGNGALDPAKDRVVGGIIGAAPAGATGQSATTPTASGTKLWSGKAVRDPGFPRGGGASVPGLLVVEFRTGSAPGDYRPTFELVGGNQFTFTLRAR